MKNKTYKPIAEPLVLKKNRIAVLLPVYNKDKPEYLLQSIKSVVHQSIDKTDLILLVDGPVNKYLEEVVFRNKNTISKIIKFDKNYGMTYVLNRGLEYCLKVGYLLIGRMDADDISLPNRFELQMEYLFNNSQVDVVGGAIEEIDESGKSRNKIIMYPLTHSECFRFFAKRDPLAHPAALFRKRFFEKAGMYNEKFRKNQDTQLWYQGFKSNCVFANIPEVVLKFRITDDFFSKRRGGGKRAKMILKERIKINKDLGYGLYANLYAYAMFLLTIAPSFLRKFAYRVFR